MELREPKFTRTEFVYYNEDGIQIKEDAPEWVKKEYEEFKRNLQKNRINY